MKREQMVERVAEMQAHPYAVNDADRAKAEDFLEAILPQVTTVAELEAFGPEALVVDSTGLALVAECVLETDFKRGPLTVVWQPEVTK